MRPLERAPRGNVLMVVLIALAVLMVMVVGAIQFTGTNREAAVSNMKAGASTACAETARRYLLSRLNLFGVPVTDLVLADEKLPEANNEVHRVSTAHYGESVDAGVKSIAVVDAASLGTSRSQIRDLSNAAPAGTTLGGSYYRVVVKCTENNNRESELEFLFRYGL
ncbi:MAG TPA: hypothetical protein VND93_33090 [Myxococcales bacterium]|jgi:hypothetical protein|nr:hypothetical protein [Myxococcales bacterium]